MKTATLARERIACIDNGSRGDRALAIAKKATAVLTLAGSLALVTSSSASAVMNVRIANTQGQGVSSRSAPNLAAKNGYGAPEGAVVSIQCHAFGEAVGPRANRLWDYVAYAGRAFYVPDLYTDSPTTANKGAPAVPVGEVKG